MFLEPLSKSSGEFPYLFLITLHPVTFISIDDFIPIDDLESSIGINVPGWSVMTYSHL